MKYISVYSCMWPIFNEPWHTPSSHDNLSEHPISLRNPEERSHRGNRLYYSHVDATYVLYVLPQRERADLLYVHLSVGSSQRQRVCFQGHFLLQETFTHYYIYLNKSVSHNTFVNRHRMNTYLVITGYTEPSIKHLAHSAAMDCSEHNYNVCRTLSHHISAFSVARCFSKRSQKQFFPWVLQNNYLKGNVFCCWWTWWKWHF